MDIDSFNGRLLDDLCMEMISYYEGDPKRIQHFLKVHSLAKLIGMGEELDQETMLILEAAAYTHDIGIKPAEEKYGSSDGKLQEQEGPIEAQFMLGHLGFENYIIDRICYLIGHHHTYTDIDGMDYQILVEADFLVNFYEDHLSSHTIDNTYQTIFKTETGKSILRTMYGRTYE